MKIKDTDLNGRLSELHQVKTQIYFLEELSGKKTASQQPNKQSRDHVKELTEVLRSTVCWMGVIHFPVYAQAQEGSHDSQRKLPLKPQLTSKEGKQQQHRSQITQIKISRMTFHHSISQRLRSSSPAFPVSLILPQNGFRFFCFFFTYLSISSFFFFRLIFQFPTPKLRIFPVFALFSYVFHLISYSL